jgi:hypothetical protein
MYPRSLHRTFCLRRLISPESGGAYVKQLPELDQPGRHRGAYRRTSCANDPDELTAPGDYQLPFAKVDAGTKATK